MKLFVDNSHATLWFCLNINRWVGFLVPDELTGVKKILYPFYFFFWFMFIVGIYVIAQTGSLFQVNNDLTEVTNICFLLFTNLALIVKIINIMVKKRDIQAIIDEGEEVLRNETRAEGKSIVHSASMDNRILINFYASVTVITIVGWAVTAEKNQMPMKAWYPYDTTKSPAYELTYAHQCVATAMLALVNATLDQVATSLVSVCRARLRLVNLSLTTLTEGLDATDQIFTGDQEKVLSDRLRDCVMQHQAALASATRIQDCFSEPILAQFTVSLVIICATLFQIASGDGNNVVRLLSMVTYLMCMVIQVFIYCYQGNHLTVESYEVLRIAYECPWYKCSVPVRRTLLMMMTRSSNVLELSAGGFTPLSLDSFMSIIKASYSFFTVLQQVEE